MDAILLVIEPVSGLTEVHAKFIELFPTKVILVLNQVDRLATGDVATLAAQFGAIAVSAHSGAGVQELLDVLQDRFIPQIPPPGAAVPFCCAQVAALQVAEKHLAKNEFAAAERVIGELLR